MSEAKTLNHLEDVVLGAAKTQKASIDREIQQIKARHLSTAKRDAIQNSKDKIDKKTSEIKIHYQKMISDAVYENKKALITIRDNIEKQVFDSVKEKIISFTDSGDYEQYLKDKLARLNNTYDNVIYCREKDFSLVLRLCEAVGNLVSVKPEPNITLGGFIAVCEEKRLTVNETFDKILDNLHPYFEEISKLTII